MSDTIWTIQKLLTWTTQHFAKLGLDSPRLDAELLLAHALGCSRMDLMVRYHEEPTEAERAAFRALVQQRAKRWPTAYLIGRREFYMLPFTVSPAVLIPRPDTETLVQTAIDWLRPRPTPRVLDLGTGSGCVAIAIAQGVKSAQVLAVDISPDAVELAEHNAAANRVADRVTVIRGDWLEAVSPEARFDLIVSNPPYIATGELASLMPEVRDHEPRLALDGGPDGLAFYRRLADRAADRLTSGGRLMLEIGHDQAESVRAILETAGWHIGRVIPDAGGRPRVVVAER